MSTRPVYPLLHPPPPQPHSVTLALLATLAAAQTPAAPPADAATTINLKPVLRPAFKRTAAGEYDVPATATTDYGAALQSALAKWAGVKDDAVAVTAGTPVVASKPGTKVVEAGVTCAGPNVSGCCWVGKGGGRRPWGVQRWLFFCTADGGLPCPPHTHAPGLHAV